MASGLWNPFVLPGQPEPGGNRGGQVHPTDGYYDGRSARPVGRREGHRDLFQLGGGAVYLAGSELQRRCGVFATERHGHGSGGPNGDDRVSAMLPPRSRTRRRAKSMACSPELVAPVTKALELSAAMRYDDYKNIDSALNGV